MEKSDYTPIDPEFFQAAFSGVANTTNKEELSPVARVICEEHDDLSRRLDRSGIQESCSVRNVLKTRALSQLLFAEDGELNLAAVKEAIDVLNKHMHSLGPERELDTPRNQHLLNVLRLIYSKKEVQAAIKAITTPYQNRTAEQLIRETLKLSPHIPIKDIHARQACLSAWMCMLRQNVGSCFATAPAIVVHEEQPLQMLLDLQELLSTGRLNRVYGGVEFSAPLSVSWGAGDIKKVVDLTQECILCSPGLTNALVAAQVISDTFSADEQKDACKHLFEKVAPTLGRFAAVSDVIKAIILDQCGLTAKDLEEALLKEKAEKSSLMMTMGGTSGKSKRFALFEQRLQIAETEFKQLADNPLLKSWEFTLASFSESKADFTRWNLYASLGLRPEEKGGLGECLYNYLKQKVEEYNQKAQEMHEDYERAYVRLKYAEGRLNNASTEKEIQWMRAEYQSSRNEFYTLEEIRNDYNRKAQRFGNMFDGLMNEYDDLFFKYFQEVYDADLHDINAGPYDDSPAGFRLVYKYGRRNSSQWAFINDQYEFIECLSQFFSNTEIEIASHDAFHDIEHDLSQIVSALIKHVRTQEFLETAFDRMALAHQTRPIKDPLNHLDQIDKKPWVYTSGGTMNNLVSAYWGRDAKPTSVERWVENPMELFVFFVDTLKLSPLKNRDLFIKAPERRMLMHSPTHAFTLLPGKKLFAQAWNDDAFTYTWLRDELVKPRKEFVETLILDEEMIEAFLGCVAKEIPIELRPSLLQTIKQIHGRHTPMELKKELVQLLPKINPEMIDEWLYTYLPMLPINQFGERFKYLVNECHEIPKTIQDKMIMIYDDNPVPYSLERYVPIKVLINAVRAFYCLATNKTSDSLNIYEIVLFAAQRLGYTYPEPIVVADSNWVREFFAFVVNPGTGELDFWRMDPSGAKGGPITGWRMWLNGSRQKPVWGIYTQPFEYTSKYSLF